MYGNFKHHMSSFRFGQLKLAAIPDDATARAILPGVRICAKIIFIY